MGLFETATTGQYRPKHIPVTDVIKEMSAYQNLTSTQIIKLRLKRDEMKKHLKAKETTGIVQDMYKLSPKSKCIF